MSAFTANCNPTLELSSHIVQLQVNNMEHFGRQEHEEDTSSHEAQTRVSRNQVDGTQRGPQRKGDLEWKECGSTSTSYEGFRSCLNWCNLNLPLDRKHRIVCASLWSRKFRNIQPINRHSILSHAVRVSDTQISPNSSSSNFRRYYSSDTGNVCAGITKGGSNTQR